MDMATLNSFNNKPGLTATTAAPRTSEVSKTTDAAVAAEVRKNDSMADMTEGKREQVLAAVTEMQDYVDAAGRSIQFQLDDDSGRMVVKVTEALSGDVIRQMPSEEALRLAENLADMRSVLFSGEA